MLRSHVAAPSGAAAPGQCRRRGLSSAWRGTTVVTCDERAGRVFASSCSLTKEMEVAHVTENGVARGELTLGETLRPGSLLEDGLSYKESFVIRTYEVGVNKTATIEAIANMMQEVACNHTQSLGCSTDGFGTTTAMRKLRLIWVTNRMHIEMYKYPAWGDVVEIETWYQTQGRIGTRRDWIMKNLSNGEVIGRATSMWVMMHQDTRKLQRVSDDVREECLVFCPRTPRYAFPEEDNGSLKKIPKLDEPAEHSLLGLVPRRADLDMNQHVNNVTYISWVLESMPQVIIDTHELESITLDYRRECQHDDSVDSLTSAEYEDAPESGFSNGVALSTVYPNQQFLHFLRLSGTGLEINRGRTTWRKLKVKK